MTTPLLKAIKRLIPHCHLIYATDIKYSQGALADVILHNSYVDEIIPFSEATVHEYDYSVDITTTGLDREKSGSIPPNRIDMFADAVGVSVDADPVPIYEVKEDEREEANKEIKEKYLNGRDRDSVRLIVVQARSNDARRTWPLKHVEKLNDILAEDENNIILVFDWGKTAEKWKQKGRIFPIKNMELPKVAAIVEQSDLVVCPDSAMLHLAGALNKKIVSIFGPIPPESRINHYNNASAVKLNLACSGCWYSPKCTRGSSSTKLECLNNLLPETVAKAIEQKLSEPLKTEPMIKYGKDISTGGQDPIILVRRTTSGIGDILMASTGIEALKIKYPTKKIHVACKNSVREAIINHPSIDEIIDVDAPINNKRYFMIIDISYPCARYESTRIRMKKPVEKNRVELFAEALGVRNLISDIKPRFYLTEDEIEQARMFFKGTVKNEKKKIAIALSSAELYRNWPQEHYVKLIEGLRDKFNIITLHSQRDFFLEGVIDACGMPFRRAMAILSQCDGLIRVDTGILHVAAAMNIPTIALFGPIDHRSRCKGYTNTISMKSDLDCVPCWRNSSMKCKKTGKIKCISKCMEMIPPNSVIVQAKKRFV
jgi:heptosyltransferase-2